MKEDSYKLYCRYHVYCLIFVFSLIIKYDKYIKIKTIFTNKTINNGIIIYDHDKFYFLVTIPTLLRYLCKPTQYIIYKILYTEYK